MTTEGTFHDAIESHQADVLKELHWFPICDQLLPFILGRKGDKNEKARDSSAQSAFIFWLMSAQLGIHSREMEKEEDLLVAIKIPEEGSQERDDNTRFASGSCYSRILAAVSPGTPYPGAKAPQRSPGWAHCWVRGHVTTVFLRVQCVCAPAQEQHMLALGFTESVFSVSLSQAHMTLVSKMQASIS